MIKSSILLSLCTVLGLSTFAQSAYDSAKIPENLLKDAVAVVRTEDQVYHFKGLSNGELEYKTAITILNKGGDDLATMVIYYDKLSSVSNIKATLYDASGKKVKEYKSSDISDQSMTSDFSIFDDNRAKGLRFISNNYPYTIEYSYTQNYKGIIHFPSWRSLSGYHISTEKSSYIFERPQDLSVKFLTSANIKTDSTKANDKIQYKWTCSNVPAVVKEPLTTGYLNIIDWVDISPTKFEYDNTTGNFDNWKNFGAWIHKLNENGDVLPLQVKEKVQNLVKDAKTPKEKIRILYNYLQQNTRYVSVQLGIGGFKPILAEKVSQVNYGDCKALSNYMKALLKEAGIKSNLVVIGNGMPSLNATYASMGQANHMILTVPLTNDTTFLECTSQHKPMGFIGYDNADRNVLMVTEDGGKIIHTPIYAAKDNTQLRKMNIQFSDDGSADIVMKSTYANAQFESNFPMLLLEPDDQRKRINEWLEIPGAELISFKYDQANKSLPVLTEEIKIKSNQLLTQGGEKAFLTLNLSNRQDAVPPKLEDRKTPFAVPFSFQDEDEISYVLPKGYKVEFLPKDISISSEFGNYSAKFAAKDNMITYTRTKVMNAKRFPPEKYNDLVDFYKKVYQADKQKAVLAKNP